MQEAPRPWKDLPTEFRRLSAISPLAHHQGRCPDDRFYVRKMPQTFKILGRGEHV